MRQKVAESVVWGVRSGAGIVADSDPRQGAVVDESLDKAHSTSCKHLQVSTNQCYSHGWLIISLPSRAKKSPKDNVWTLGLLPLRRQDVH